MLSRWGVLAYANSLDTVGILAKNVQSARHIFQALNCYDSKDPTSLPASTRRALAKAGSQQVRDKTLRIGIPAEYNISELESSVKKAWESTLNVLIRKASSANATVTVHRVSLPSTQQALSAYYVLAPAEASSNLAKYDGVRYGSRAADTHSDAPEGSPLFSKTRGEGFGDEVRRRILLGTYSLSAAAMDNYFIQAQKVRRLVQRDFDRAFRMQNPLLEGSADAADEGVDVLLHPTAPTLPPSLAEAQMQTSLEAYTNDVFTVPASLAGLPAVSVPVPCTDGTGREVVCGMQVVGQFGDDGHVLDVAELVESLVGG